mmetsp:Transcript_15522/g.24823  ORF Transcript_15522/g.24823 Transcript_15522/m.24823 type:complete len:120 (+) Transcript_15522:1476-1835(+)
MNANCVSASLRVIILAIIAITMGISKTFVATSMETARLLPPFILGSIDNPRENKAHPAYVFAKTLNIPPKKTGMFSDPTVTLTNSPITQDIMMGDFINFESTMHAIDALPAQFPSFIYN